ncbi:MAG: aldehyde dehydrogenase [Alphaproteobacteria bacterium]|nr:aldehyde dehydrogenase [Alphaproteobacteria bacterium]
MTKATSHRRAALGALLSRRCDWLVVSGLGSPSWDLFALGDRPDNFYLWGGMGVAAMTGLGLALAMPQRRVIVVTGDGEMLMGLGSLATIAVVRPSNLAIVVLDNELYGETGQQTTHTAGPTDLAAVARGAGFTTALNVSDERGIAELADAIATAPGPIFGNVKVTADGGPSAYPPRDGHFLKTRFRTTVLGDGAALKVYQ